MHALFVFVANVSGANMSNGLNDLRIQKKRGVFVFIICVFGIALDRLALLRRTRIQLLLVL